MSLSQAHQALFRQCQDLQNSYEVGKNTVLLFFALIFKKKEAFAIELLHLHHLLSHQSASSTPAIQATYDIMTDPSQDTYCPLIQIHIQNHSQSYFSSDKWFFLLQITTSRPLMMLQRADLYRQCRMTAASTSHQLLHFSFKDVLEPFRCFPLLATLYLKTDFYSSSDTACLSWRICQFPITLHHLLMAAPLSSHTFPQKADFKSKSLVLQIDIPELTTLVSPSSYPNLCTSTNKIQGVLWPYLTEPFFILKRDTSKCLSCP
jgi:hypothetical protein